MSTSTENETTSPATPPAPPPVTHEHISALHRRIDALFETIRHGFDEVIEWVRKVAPTAEGAANAAARAIPGVGPVLRAVEDVAGAVGAAAGSCCPHDAAHGPNGCTAKGCSCSAPGE